MSEDLVADSEDTIQLFRNFGLRSKLHHQIHSLAVLLMALLDLIGQLASALVPLTGFGHFAAAVRHHLLEFLDGRVQGFVRRVRIYDIHRLVMAQFSHLPSVGNASARLADAAYGRFWLRSTPEREGHGKNAKSALPGRETHPRPKSVNFCPAIIPQPGWICKRNGTFLQGRHISIKHASERAVVLVLPVVEKLFLSSAVGQPQVIKAAGVTA